MVKRKKGKRRRKYDSLWSWGVAYGNLSILTRGALGSGPIGFFTGEEDLTSSTKSYYDTMLDTTSDVVTIHGGEVLSLADVLTEPTLAWDQIQSNVKTNAVGMATEAIIFNTGATVLRRLLRKPINQSNRMIRKLGMGVQI
jgi:hypothetical protein